MQRQQMFVSMRPLKLPSWLIATTNTPTTYSITWNAAPANIFAAVTNAALPASPIIINVPAGTAPGTYTGTITVKNANGCGKQCRN